MYLVNNTMYTEIRYQYGYAAPTQLNNSLAFSSKNVMSWRDILHKCNKRMARLPAIHFLISPGILRARKVQLVIINNLHVYFGALYYNKVLVLFGI